MTSSVSSSCRMNQDKDSLSPALKCLKMPEPSNMLCISCTSTQEVPSSRPGGSMHRTLYNQVPRYQCTPLQTLHNELSSPLHKKPPPLLGGCDVGVGWMDFPTPLLSSHRFRPRPKIRTFSLVFGQNWTKPLIFLVARG